MNIEIPKFEPSFDVDRFKNVKGAVVNLSGKETLTEADYMALLEAKEVKTTSKEQEKEFKKAKDKKDKKDKDRKSEIEKIVKAGFTEAQAELLLYLLR